MGAGKYDAVVIGGGPAGSAAAYTLADGGQSVCLIDKSKFPRDKLCGGGLTFRSKRAFERVFGRRWKSSLFISSRHVAFFSKGSFLASLKANVPIYFTSRVSFDHYLLTLAEEAGATLELGDAVREIDLEDRSVVLRSGRQIRYEFLIGADGVNSIVAKTLFGQSFDPKTIAFALEAEVPRDKLPHQGNLVEIDFSAARWGYGWVFPKKDSFTVGVGGIHRLNPNLRIQLDRYFRLKGLDTKAFKVKGQYLPGGDFLTVPGRSNILLCGDAAGAVDPISGEGIPFAIETGGAAGKAVAAVLSHAADRSALAIYCDDYKAVLAPVRWGRFWRCFVYPRWVERLFAWAFQCEPIRKRMLVEPARHTRRFKVELPSAPGRSVSG